LKGRETKVTTSVDGREINGYVPASTEGELNIRKFGDRQKAKGPKPLI
jgi:hypothetical protein